MAAFKDKKNGSWYVQFRYTDWRGERQQKLKRGFATKKEAQAWEREFLMQKQADVNMSFESFVALYEKDVKPKLKLNTWLSKEHIIRTKILPYFKKRKLSEITARDVIDWQNEIRQHTKSSGESYSPDYLKNVHTQLSCIFNHAIKYYGLQINPAAKAGNMGSEQPKEMLFWTKEEYLKFIDAMMDKPMLYYAFEILYWCGIREGELLAQYRKTAEEICGRKLEISGGSSPTGKYVAQSGQADEIRPGTYVFSDYMMYKECGAPLENVSARLVVTVVSVHKDYVVVDGGCKTFATDPQLDQPPYFFEGYAWFPQYPELRIRRLTEEHGMVTAEGPMPELKGGDMLEAIPVHICPTVNLQNQIYVADGGVLRTEIVAGRGKLL